MKKIAPTKRYDADKGYPAYDDPDHRRQRRKRGRRSFLKTALAGVAALGGGLIGQRLARAQQLPPPPGEPPVPSHPAHPRPRRRSTAPCSTRPTEVVLEPVFRFCGDKTGTIVVATKNPLLVTALKKSGEGTRMAPVIHRVLARERTCAWLTDATAKSRVTQAIGQTLVNHYQQQLGVTLAPLVVRVVVGGTPAARPDPNRQIHPPGVVVPPRPLPLPPGVPPRPSKRGCASCSTASETKLSDLLLPAGLVALSLLGLNTRRDK